MPARSPIRGQESETELSKYPQLNFRVRVWISKRVGRHLVKRIALTGLWISKITTGQSKSNSVFSNLSLEECPLKSQKQSSQVII